VYTLVGGEVFFAHGEHQGVYPGNAQFCRLTCGLSLPMDSSPGSWLRYPHGLP
jgi:hypothetical protein